MIDGNIFFQWKDGYNLRIPFLGRLKEIKRNGERPVTYRVEILSKDLSDVEIRALNQWLRHIPAVVINE